MGMRTSSWSSASATSSSSTLTDPTFISTASRPAHPTPESTSASYPGDNAPQSSLTAEPVTVVATNEFPLPLTTDDNDVGGGKNIDFVGSLALLINNVTGGGMVLHITHLQCAPTS